MKAFRTFVFLLAGNIVVAWVPSVYPKEICSILMASRGAKKWKRKKEWLKSRGWWDGPDDDSEENSGMVTTTQKTSQKSEVEYGGRGSFASVELSPNKPQHDETSTDHESHPQRLSDQEIFLLQEIQGCETLLELLYVIHESREEMLPFHVSYCWNQLSQVMVYDKIGRKRINNEHEILLPLIEQTAKVTSEFDARSLSSTMHGIAKVSSKSNVSIDKKMWTMFKDKAMKIKSFDAKETSLLLWSFAKINVKAPDLFDFIANETLSKLDGFSPQSISNILWSYAKLNHKAVELFDASASTAIKKIDDFNPQDLSNTLWAFAKTRHPAPELFNEAILATRLRIDAFKAREIASLSSSYAKAGYAAPELFSVIEVAAVKRLNTFKSQDISNTLWAFAKLDHKAPRLFAEAEEVLIKNIDTFTPQGIANTMWAYGRLEHGTPEIFDAVAHKVNEKPSLFDSKEHKGKIEFAFRRSGRAVPEAVAGVEKA